MSIISGLWVLLPLPRGFLVGRCGVPDPFVSYTLSGKPLCPLVVGLIAFILQTLAKAPRPGQGPFVYLGAPGF